VFLLQVQKYREPTSGLEPLASSHYELHLGSSTYAEESFIYREKCSQRIVALRPITPRLEYRLV
jgi:hypothetical protein